MATYTSIPVWGAVLYAIAAVCFFAIVFWQEHKINRLKRSVDDWQRYCDHLERKLEAETYNRDAQAALESVGVTAREE